MDVWSLAGIVEKNKLANDQPFIVLVEVTVTGIPPIYLARNNEDITWNGILWQRFPIDFDKINATNSSLPTCTLKVSNVQGIIQSYVQSYAGFTDADVTIYVVHAAHLDETSAYVEVDFVVTQTKYDEQWVSFTLGASNDQKFRFPFYRYMTNFCPYHFQDIQCGYAGNLTACDGTIATCRIPLRFGGEQGIGNGR